MRFNIWVVSCHLLLHICVNVLIQLSGAQCGFLILTLLHTCCLCPSFFPPTKFCPSVEPAFSSTSWLRFCSSMNCYASVDFLSSFIVTLSMFWFYLGFVTKHEPRASHLWSSWHLMPTWAVHQMQRGPHDASSNNRGWLLLRDESSFSKLLTRVCLLF